MSEELKAKARRYIDETWNKGNLDVMNELHAPNVVRHQTPYADNVGRDAFRKFIADVRVSYPDFHITIEEIIAEGNTTMFRGTWEGTQSGISPATGIPGSGKKVKVPFCHVAHWVNGQAVEEWSVSDWMTFFQLLDYTPPQPKT